MEQPRRRLFFFCALRHILLVYKTSEGVLTLKQQGNSGKSAKKIAIGAGVSLLAYLALLALLSVLVVRGTVGVGAVGACVWVFAALAAFAGAKVAAWGAAEPLGVIAIGAAAFWLLVLLLGFFANDTLESSRAALLALPIVAGGGLAYLTCGGGKKHGKRKRRSHK